MKEGEGLTHAEVIQGCMNIGVDIVACGACAEIFYSGSTTISHACRLRQQKPKKRSAEVGLLWPTTQIRSCHSVAFHSGEWGTIEGVQFVSPPDLSPHVCYVVRFDNGDIDLWPVNDPTAEYTYRAQQQDDNTPAPLTFETLPINAQFRFLPLGSLLTKTGNRTYSAPQFGQHDMWIEDTSTPVRIAAVGFSRDPVFKSEEGWCFWDETWANFLGPYPSEDIARQKLADYCKALG